MTGAHPPQSVDAQEATPNRTQGPTRTFAGRAPLRWSFRSSRPFETREKRKTVPRQLCSPNPCRNKRCKRRLDGDQPLIVNPPAAAPRRNPSGVFRVRHGRPQRMVERKREEVTNLKRREVAGGAFCPSSVRRRGKCPNLGETFAQPRKGLLCLLGLECATRGR